MNRLILCLLLIFTLDICHAKFYRWVDENGKVHYSDRVPPSASGTAKTKLNEQGLAVEHQRAAMTEEEIKKEKELQRKREEQKRLVAEQKKSDRVLLRTFRSEDDIYMARNGKLASIDAKIQVVRGSIRRQKMRLGELQLNAANTEREGKRVPANLLKQIAGLRKQIRDDYQGVIIHEQLKQNIRERYAKDLSRFRELKNLQGENQFQKESKTPEFSLLDTLVVCKANCDKLWEKAEEYLRKHATTRMQLVGSNIILTRPPRKDTDVSLTISRITNKAGHEEMFMDIQCKDSSMGKRFCAGDKARKIRFGFKKALTGTVTQES